MPLDLGAVNVPGVLVGAAVALGVGALWYGPLFGNAWMREMGLEKDRFQPSPDLFVASGIAWLLASAVYGAVAAAVAVADPVSAVLLAVLLWLGFSAGFYVMAGMYQGKTMTLLAIDTSYHLTGLMMIGIVRQGFAAGLSPSP